LNSADLEKDFLNLERESGAAFRNVGIHLPHDEAVYRRRKESSATPLRKLQNLRNDSTYEKQQPSSGNKFQPAELEHSTSRHRLCPGPIRSSHPIPLILISILTSQLCLCFVPFLYLSAFRKPVAKSACELCHVLLSIWLQGINRRPPERIEWKQIMDSYYNALEDSSCAYNLPANTEVLTENIITLVSNVTTFSLFANLTPLFFINDIPF